MLGQSEPLSWEFGLGTGGNSALCELGSCEGDIGACLEVGRRIISQGRGEVRIHGEIFPVSGTLPHSRARLQPCLHSPFSIPVASSWILLRSPLGWSEAGSVTCAWEVRGRGSLRKKSASGCISQACWGGLGLICLARLNGLVLVCLGQSLLPLL